MSLISFFVVVAFKPFQSKWRSRDCSEKKIAIHLKET